MSIQELTALAARINAIADLSEGLAMTAEECIQEMRYLARLLNQQADELDLEMDRQFLQEYA